LSLAVPLNATVVPAVEYVAAEVGPVTVTAGAVTSGEVIVQVNDWEAVSHPSDAVAITLKEPAVVGVPEMKPVDDWRAKPGGSPVVVYDTDCPSGSTPWSCSVVACDTKDDRAPGLTSVGGRLLNPQTSADFGPSIGPEKYADTAKQYCWPATAPVKE
jgi:hypothetical protein